MRGPRQGLWSKKRLAIAKPPHPEEVAVCLSAPLVAPAGSAWSAAGGSQWRSYRDEALVHLALVPWRAAVAGSKPACGSLATVSRTWAA